MCGILGTLNNIINENDLDTIKHRGYDDCGIIRQELGKEFVMLGHRRLSILDISESGHQPMISHCGNYIITFNGEIYNHLELREKLDGIHFKGHSDTETIVNYIAKYGIESIKDFNGIFAFGLLDIKNNKIYLVRDRFGIKPIYYYWKDSELIFSSEIRPIKRKKRTSLNNASFSELLKLRYIPAPETLFNNIYKVRPGHFIEINIDEKKLTERSYLTKIDINHSISIDDAIDQYGILLEQAIKRQLLSDVEVGVLLSGGIDSAIVAFYAQKYWHKKIKTFTVGFSEVDLSNEINEATENSGIIGTDHRNYQITQSNFEEIFSNIVSIVEEPLGTTSVIPMYYLTQLVSKHVKVALSGQGADEPLGGYSRYMGELIGGMYPRFLFSMAKPFKMFIHNEKHYRAINSLSEKYAPKRFEKIYSLFSNNEINKLIGMNTEDLSLKRIEYYYDLLECHKKNSVEAMMTIDKHLNLSDDLLLYTDKISMHFTLETRVPFLDNNLINFIDSLPYSFKIRGKESKYIHKKFAETILPQKIVYRDKKNFSSPTKKWFNDRKNNGYLEKLTDSSSKFSNYFDRKMVNHLFDIHFKGQRNMEKQLFLLVSLYYWLEENT